MVTIIRIHNAKISFLIIAVKKNKAGMNSINTNRNMIKNHNRQSELKRYPIHFIQQR